MRLKGKCAIITGGSYGIGFATARRFLDEGASVAVADIKGHEEAAQKLLSVETPGRVLGIRADVTDDLSVANLVRSVISEFGAIDILVNNAAVSAELKPRPFEDYDMADWARVMDVNVLGAARMCKAVSPHMRGQKSGRIINVSSGTALKGSPGFMPYVASKGALISMTRALAREMGEDGVVVNAVAPGFTLTESVKSKDYLMAAAECARNERPSKRDAFAGDVANVIYFLACADAEFVTGQLVMADGGTAFH